LIVTDDEPWMDEDYSAQCGDGTHTPALKT